MPCAHQAAKFLTAQPFFRENKRVSLTKALKVPHLRTIETHSHLEEKKRNPSSFKRRECVIGLSSLLSIPLFYGEADAAARYRDSYDDEKLLEQNRRIQRLNGAPENFPGFIREGNAIKSLFPVL